MTNINPENVNGSRTFSEYWNDALYPNFSEGTTASKVGKVAVAFFAWILTVATSPVWGLYKVVQHFKADGVQSGQSHQESDNEPLNPEDITSLSAEREIAERNSQIAAELDKLDDTGIVSKRIKEFEPGPSVLSRAAGWFWVKVFGGSQAEAVEQLNQVLPDQLPPVPPSIPQAPSLPSVPPSVVSVSVDSSEREAVVRLQEAMTTVINKIGEKYFKPGNDTCRSGQEVKKELEDLQGRVQDLTEDDRVALAKAVETLRDLAEKYKGRNAKKGGDIIRADAQAIEDAAAAL